MMMNLLNRKSGRMKMKEIMAETIKMINQTMITPLISTNTTESTNISTNMRTNDSFNYTR